MQPQSPAQLTLPNVQAIAEMEKMGEQRRTRGEKLADRFAATVGSWTFIIIQSCILVLWMIANVVAWVRHWDPYPFILLNLTLSFQAAYAAPIIMMSQNRQTKLAERQHKLDLQINMLSEQENTEMIRLLRKICEKSGIEIEEGVVQSMEKTTEPKEIVKQLERAEESKHPHGSNLEKGNR